MEDRLDVALVGDWLGQSGRQFGGLGGAKISTAGENQGNACEDQIAVHRRWLAGHAELIALHYRAARLV